MAGSQASALSRPEGWFRRAVDPLLALRDRLLASPRFQRHATAFALTRPIAARRAARLFDLVGGFAYSQVLLACVRLQLFTILAEGPQGLDPLAARLGLTRDAARCLLDAAVALQLASRRGSERYGLGKLGAPMVGNAAVDAMVLHHAALYADLTDPVALLRATPQSRRDNALARYWCYDSAQKPDDDPAVATYTTLMATSHALVADPVLDAYPMAAHRCLLDIGGGDGSFLIRAAQRAPKLSLVLFDLPAVAAHARQRLEAAGLGQRARVHGGSFLRDPLPRGADVASLVRVIHDHDDDVAMTILRAVRTALPAGGTLLLAEPMSKTPGAEGLAAYFGIYLWAMGSGRPRSAGELTQMLHGAGFVDVRRRGTRQPLQTGLLVAKVPQHPRKP